MNAGILGFLRPSIGEILVIALIVVILFGARRLPDLGKTIGTAIRNFQRSFKGEDGNE